ncbi:MAG: ABC transporter ATP-binding protein [Deltaproteobacteria bacterium]|jgi:multiple sugar transport system ATP-binding protein|nr:ABC transporter ATP-binding protein [Deltaproteobacteria bacterium]
MEPFLGLTASGLSKNYGPKKALDNVSFKAPKAGFTVILGPGGAGKTTTLRLLAGLEPQLRGEIFLGDTEISKLAPKDRNLAMIFDNLALYPNKNGFQNLASPLIQRKVPFEQIRSRVFEIAEKLNLSLVLDRLPKTMSGGEKQRLALGRALVREPRFFLLDEPLSSLDAPLRYVIRAELKRLQREEGHSFLMATPDFTEALAVADTIIVLNEGKVVQTGDQSDIYDRPVNTHTALFVGSPQINLLRSGYSNGRISLLGQQLPCPAHLSEVLAQRNLAKFTIGLRPENVSLILPNGPTTIDKSPNEKPNNPQNPLYPDILAQGPIIDIESLGRTLSVTVGIGRELVTMLAPATVLDQISIGLVVDFKIKDPTGLSAFDIAGLNIAA